MEPVRTRFQGVANIVRFNWHFYAIAASAAILVFFLLPILPDPLRAIAWIGLIAVAASTVISLLVSYHVYDRSDLYDCTWTSDFPTGATIVNINAGFDETSATIESRLPKAKLHIWDFYNEAKHTEISIRRARHRYPPHPETTVVGIHELPLEDRATDRIILFMALHEVRDPEERTGFLKEARRILKDDGRIIVTEHLRDLSNFLAYTIGFLHFYSKATWLESFAEAGLTVLDERKETPLVSTFTLAKS